MALPMSVSGSPRDTVIDLAVASLPLLATVALYLPGGLLMPFRLVSLGLAGAAVWHLVRPRRPTAPRTLLGIGLLAGCFLGFGLLGWVRFRSSAAEDLVRVVFLFLVVGAVAVLATRRRSVVWLVLGWLVAGAVAAAVGIWEVLTGQHLPKHASAAEFADTLPGWNVIASFFDNPNLYAYQVSIVLLLLPVGFAVLPRGWRLLTVPFGLGLVYLLARTEGRIAVLAVLVGLLLWALRSRGGRVLALLGVAAFAVAALARVPLALQVLAEADNALVEFEQEGASSWVRTELARNAWWITEQSGYLGVGPGGFGTWSVRPDNPYRYQQLNNAHSGLLEVLSEYGVVTALVLLALLAVGAAAALRAARGVPVWQLDRMLAYAAFVLIAAWPLLSAAHSTWLRQPLAAAHMATVVALLARAEARSDGGDG
nr:hypothetical protein [Propionibacterium sp.]